jgi:hypothetical protein
MILLLLLLVAGRVRMHARLQLLSLIFHGYIAVVVWMQKTHEVTGRLEIISLIFLSGKTVSARSFGSSHHYIWLIIYYPYTFLRIEFPEDRMWELLNLLEFLESSTPSFKPSKGDFFDSGYILTP